MQTPACSTHSVQNHNFFQQTYYCYRKVWNIRKLYNVNFMTRCLKRTKTLMTTMESFVLNIFQTFRLLTCSRWNRCSSSGEVLGNGSLLGTKVCDRSVWKKWRLLSHITHQPNGSMVRYKARKDPRSGRVSNCTRVHWFILTPTQKFSTRNFFGFGPDQTAPNNMIQIPGHGSIVCSDSAVCRHSKMDARLLKSRRVVCA